MGVAAGPSVSWRLDSAACAGPSRRGRGDHGDCDLRHGAVRDYHFHHFVLFGILANVVAVPISAMWTLPWDLVSSLLMPFGLETFGLIPMGWGIEATIWTGQW